MNKKRIGITSQISINTNHTRMHDVSMYNIEAIEKAGGLPIVLPAISADLVDDYLDTLDGIYFTGGVDVNPMLYGEDPVKEIKDISFERDNFEYILAKKAYERGIPMFGVCRGMQLINVVLGGSLYQDIYTQLENIISHNSLSTMKHGFHNIKIEKNSYLHKVYNKEELFVNSNHHQAVKDLGTGLVATAHASDGIIEAFESIIPEKKVVCVQFHPEIMIAGDEAYIDIFRNFIEMI